MSEWVLIHAVGRWVYLFFFNTLWVWIPVWLLYEAYNTFLPALALQSMVAKAAGTANTLSGATFDDESDEEESDEQESDEEESDEEESDEQEGEGKKGR